MNKRKDWGNYVGNFMAEQTFKAKPQLYKHRTTQREPHQR